MSAWADDEITSLPYTADFASSVAPFDNGSVETSNTAIGSVFHLTNETATAWFDADASADGNQAYVLGNKETVTVSFTAFQGWFNNGGPIKIQLLNSGDVSLVEYTYTSGSANVTDVKLGGATPTTFASFSGQSFYGANKGANGISGNGKPYQAAENFNPTITMSVSGNGYVTFLFVSQMAGVKNYTATLSDVTMDLAKIVITDGVSNEDRSICIDNLSITTETATTTQYAYTVKFYDENSEFIKEEQGMGDEGSTVEVSQEDFEFDGKKYHYVSDDAASNVLTAADKVITVACKEFDKYSYTVNAVNKGGSILEEIETGSVYVGETKRVYYPRSLQVEGQWYTTKANAVLPTYGIDVTEEGTVSVVYNMDNGIAYYCEGDDLIGSSSNPWAAGTGMPDGMSAGNASRLAANRAAWTEALAVGTYNVTIRVRNQRGAESTETFVGLYLRDEEGNTTDLEENFEEWKNGTLEERTIEGVEIPEGGYAFQIGNGEWNSNLEIDYIVFETGAITLESSANLEGYKTFYNATQSFEVDENTSIYTVSGARVEVADPESGDEEVSLILAKVNGSIIPAATPVILKTTSEDYTITLTPTSAEAPEYPKNFLSATDESMEVPQGYILAYWEGKGLAFYLCEATLEPGSVYIPYEEYEEVVEEDEVIFEEAARIRLVVNHGEATAIKVVNTSAKKTGIIYNVAGQKVNESYKGIVIKNGKKYFQK